MSESRRSENSNPSLSSASEGRSWPLQNLPNLITALRIFLIPVFFLLFLTPSPSRSLCAAIVFLLASATDLLDGYVARKLEQVTRLGKFLDPIADKLLVITALILLVQFQRVSALLSILLIGRDMTITGLRAVASDYGIVIPAERLGKLKMFLQIVAITLLILDSAFLAGLGEIDIHRWGTLLLWLSLLLAMLSAYKYFYNFIKELRRRG
jgi:CDP-diacylglycerol---glycerol-3-phosphate 3-phosphatidyltransferase